MKTAATWATGSLRLEKHLTNLLFIPSRTLVETVNQFKEDIVIHSLMEEDGWLFKGDKMEVLTLTETGQIMKMDLAA